MLIYSYMNRYKYLHKLNCFMALEKCLGPLGCQHSLPLLCSKVSGKTVPDRHAHYGYQGVHRAQPGWYLSKVHLSRNGNRKHFETLKQKLLVFQSVAENASAFYVGELFLQQNPVRAT